MNNCTVNSFGDLYGWPEVQDNVEGDVKVYFLYIVMFASLVFIINSTGGGINFLPDVWYAKTYVQRFH